MLETGFNRTYTQYTESVMRFSITGGRLGPYLEQSQSAEYVLPSSKKALINGRLDTSVAMVGGAKVEPSRRSYRTAT